MNRVTVEVQNKILQEKLDERVTLTAVTDDSHPNHEVNRALALELCEKDWRYFVNNFCWLHDPEAVDPKDQELPYLLYDFQEQAGADIVRAIEQGYDLPIEKSRAMGITWLVLVILFWGWHFKKWDCLVGSRKAEEVDRRGDMGTLFEKIRFMMKRLPLWMFTPLHTNKHDKGMTLIHPVHGASIVGEGNNPDFGRSDRRKVAFLDEFTSWEQTDKPAWQGLSATTRCRIPVSTPNTRGTNCYFYEIIDYAKKNDRPHLTLHWTLHPVFSKGLYTTEIGKEQSPWYDNQVERSVDEQSVAQELDINYDVAMAGKVFPTFDPDINITPDAKYNPKLPLYIAWDFGLDSTAILWIHYDPEKHLFYIFDEYVNKSIDIYHYIDILDSKEYKSGIHFGDPHSGENRQLTSGQSPATILRRYGIVFRSQRTKITTRVAAGRNMLSAVRVSPECQLTIDMFRNWQMRKPKTGNQQGQIPDHSPHSHIGESYTYFSFNFRNKEQAKPIKRKIYAAQASGVM